MANMTNCPFIGGPLDGQHREMLDDRAYCLAETPGGGTRVRYLRHVLAGPTRRFSFFALETLSVDDALSSLVHCYPGVAGIKGD